MATKSLAEVVRDSTPGFNTILTIDELAKLGLNAIVIGENVKQRRYILEQEGVDALEPTTIGDEIPVKIIDRKWVEEHALGARASDAGWKERVDAAHAEYRRSLDETDSYKEHEEKRRNYEQAQRQYDSFNPVSLTRYLRGTDLIVAPANLLPKLNREFPGVRKAVAITGNSEFAMVEPAKGNNYVRVVMRDVKDDGYRIDSRTVQLLFEPGESDGLMGRLLSRDYDEFTFRRLSEGFYDGALELPKRQKVKRTPIASFRKKEISTDEPFNGISNSFSHGGNRSGQHMLRGQKLLDDIWQQKRKAIVEMYDGLWLKPINSLEQILDRQTLISRLVEDGDHFDRVSELEKRINAVLEPFYHLSGMMNHATANILHSKWGAPLQKQAYYDDFKHVATEFMNAYRELRDFPVVDDGSREMRALISPMRYLLESQSAGTVRTVYEVVMRIMKPKPLDFNHLWASIETQLGKARMQLHPQLESFGIEYSTQPDPPREPRMSFEERMRDEFGFDDYDAGFSSDDEPDKAEKSEDGSNRTHSIRKKLSQEQQRQLEGMQDRFYAQNPVTRAQKSIDYLDYVSSKLSAYLGLARFIKNNGWVKPEILPGELGIVDIVQGYYPFLEAETRVANDTHLDAEHAVEIIEGTNMGGKTVDAKKAMFIATVALTGNYVPAQSARISQFERVRYRIKDTGGYGSGAFRADLREVEEVVSELGKPILVGLDETFTSTNAREGEAMTYAVIMRLVEAGNARAVVTSHYPTLHDIQGTRGVFFSHFEFERSNGGIIFSHVKKPGANLEGDYALAIAEREHLHPVLLAHAREYQARMGGKP